MMQFMGIIIIKRKRRLPLKFFIAKIKGKKTLKSRGEIIYMSYASYNCHMWKLCKIIDNLIYNIFRCIGGYKRIHC